MANVKNSKTTRTVATRTNARKRSSLAARNNREKKMLFAIVALTVLLMGSIGVAVAAFSSDLYIRGTATVRSTVWNVHFQNLKPVVTTGEYAKEITAPTIQTSVDGNALAAIKTYDVELKEPGDAVEYDFEVINEGDMDAKLAAVTINTGSNLACTSAAGQEAADKVCAKLNYTLKYDDGTTVAAGDTLPARANGTYIWHV